MRKINYTFKKVAVVVGIVVVAVGVGFLIYSLSTSPSQDTDEAKPARRTLKTEPVIATTTTILGNWQLPMHWAGDTSPPDCAVHTDGTISCWGPNFRGQVAVESVFDTEETGPLKVPGLNNMKAVTIGGSHTCGLHTDGTVSCWGSDEYNALGNGFDSGFDYSDPANRREHISYAPVKILDANNNPLNNIETISAGGGFTCAVHSDGTISCWGLQGGGQLGDGQFGIPEYYDYTFYPSQENYKYKFGSKYPVKVVGIDDAIDVSAGGLHSCALHVDTTISCWGLNWAGQIGNGTHDLQRVPVKVRNADNQIARGFSDVEVSGATTCALHIDQTVSCWGWGLSDFEHVRDPSIDDYLNTPTKILNADNTILSNIKEISVGGYACALDNDGTVTCWTPKRIEKSPIVNHVKSISHGGSFLCTLHTDLTTYCWGNDYFGAYSIGYITSDVQALASR